MKKTIIFVFCIIQVSCFILKNKENPVPTEVLNKRFVLDSLMNNERKFKLNERMSAKEFENFNLQSHKNLADYAKRNNMFVEHTGKKEDLATNDVSVSFCSSHAVCETENICLTLCIPSGSYIDQMNWFLIKNNNAYYIGTKTGADNCITINFSKNDFGGTGDYTFACETRIWAYDPNNDQYGYIVNWLYHDSPVQIEFQSLPCSGLNCIDPCAGIGSFDTRNCFIGKAPAGTIPFIYDGNFYYTGVNGSQCPLQGSSWDNAHCFVMKIPSNRTGFIWDGNFYLRPVCDPPGPKKKIYLRSFKITKDKEGGSANDVSFAIRIYPVNSCNNFSSNSEIDFKNVYNWNINNGDWFNVNKELTTTTLTLSPNYLIAINLYEYDGNWYQNWIYNCNNGIGYNSKQNAYGTIVLPYSTFLDNADIWYKLDGCEIIIGSSNQ